MANVQEEVSLYLDYNGDFLVSPGGGLVLAQGWDLVRQRMMRAIMTVPQRSDANGNVTPGDNVFVPDMGAGLRAHIGDTPTADQLESIRQTILRAASEDPAVDPQRPPSITFRQSGKFVYIIAQVFLANSEQGVIALRAG